VTVISYGAPAWCKPCLQLDATLESVCQNYKANSKFVVGIYTVDVDRPDADATKPKATGVQIPMTFVFGGSVKTDQFQGAKPASDIYPMINKAAAKASSAQPPAPTPKPSPAPAPTPSPAPAPAPAPAPTSQACSLSIVGIDGNDTLENTRKYSDAEIAKGRAENPAATSDAQIPTITNGCPRQTYQVVLNQQNARILHVSWKKTPPQPAGSTLSVIRVAIDDGGDMPPGKARSVSALNPQTNPLPMDCSYPKTLTNKPAWCVPFCSFGEFQMEVSIAFECGSGASKQVNTVLFGPKRIMVKQKKP
jgi:hypothetical protein